MYRLVIPVMDHSMPQSCSSAWLVMPPATLTRRVLERIHPTWEGNGNDTNCPWKNCTKKWGGLGGLVTVGGLEVQHPLRTKRSPIRFTEKSVSAAGGKQCLSITVMKTGLTTNRTTWNRCANGVTRLASTTVQQIYLARSCSNQSHVLRVGISSPQQAPAAFGVTTAAGGTNILIKVIKTTALRYVSAAVKNSKHISTTFRCADHAVGKGTENVTSGAIKNEATLEQRYSQYLQQCRVVTEGSNFLDSSMIPLNYGKHSNSLARELGFFDRIKKEHPELDDWEVRRAGKAEAQELIDAYFKRIPGAAKFIKGTYRIVADTKYVETFLGRRRWLRQIMDWDEKQEHSQLELTRSRGKRDLCWCNDCKSSRDGERRSCNSIIQGCLPTSTRVLTKDGILPIGRICKQGTVWTGQHWAPYKKVDRGLCELAEIKLDNGQILKCDTRHEVLTIGERSYKFKKWSNLKAGDQVCLSMARIQESGSSTSGVLPAEQVGYWLGFSIGNGYTSKDSRHKNALAVTFGDRKGRYKKDSKAVEFTKFIRSYGFENQKPRVYNGKITVVVEAARLREWWEQECGYPWGCTSHKKSIPTLIWVSDSKTRIGFLLGLMDADGYVGGNQPNLHMCNKYLLHEVQLLARTIGVESRLHGPYTSSNFISWRLDFNGGHLAALGYGKRKREVSFDQAPPFVVRDFVAGVQGTKVERGSDSTLLNRMGHGGSTSVYTLRRLAKKYNVDIKVYASAKVIETRSLGVKEVTYTLSVDDVDHQFDSEGVISKNTAADIVMCAMIRCHFDSRLTRLGVKMLLQIHDELVFECPEENVDEACPIIQYNMENPGIKLRVPLKAAPGVGNNWNRAK